jgi:hypothetical protein
MGHSGRWFWPGSNYMGQPKLASGPIPSRGRCPWHTAGSGLADTGLPAARCNGEAARSSSVTRWTGLRGRPGRRLTGGGHPRQRRSSGGELVAAARTSGRGVTGVVGEVSGTDVELEEVEAGAESAEGGPSAWRHCHGEEDRTRGATVTWRGTPDHGSARHHSGTKSTRAATKAAPEAAAQALGCGGPMHQRRPRQAEQRSG